MITVYKYEISPLDVGNKTYVELPEFAKILCVGTQSVLVKTGTVVHPDERLFLWALVNSNSPKTRRELLVLGTGHEVINEVNMNKYRYIGTAFFKQNILVYHVWELIA